MSLFDGFYSKYPELEWENLEKLNIKQEVVPQDILDAIILYISYGKVGIITRCQWKKFLTSLEELGREIARIGKNEPFNIPIFFSLKKNQLAHNYKAFEYNIFMLNSLWSNVEGSIESSFKDDNTHEIKLYRDICVRIVKYIAELLPNSLGYDTIELTKDYAFVLDSYIDKLAWENLGIEEHFSTDFFIDSWNKFKELINYLKLEIEKSNILSMFAPNKYQNRLEKEVSDRLTNVSKDIFEALTTLKMPHIHTLYYDFYAEFEQDDIAEFYLKGIAGEAKNIRKIMWTLEGKELIAKLDFFMKNLSYDTPVPKSIIIDIKKSITKSFIQYFESMPPGSLWLKLTSFIYESESLYENYPLASVENPLFAEKQKQKEFKFFAKRPWNFHLNAN